MSNSSSSSSGIGIVGMIFIVLLFLKLAEIGPVADWSWWWITSPLWISTLIGISFFVFLVWITNK
jgi:small Trp-rich protein